MNERIGMVLILTAVSMMVIGAVLIAAVGALVGGIVILVGLFDLMIGIAFRSGALRSR
jgi:hypothetical protein